MQDLSHIAPRIINTFLVLFSVRNCGNTLKTYKNVSSALKGVVIGDDFLAENCGTIVDGVASDASQILY